MPSWKSFVLGGIAVGGVAVAAYATYRFCKSYVKEPKKRSLSSVLLSLRRQANPDYTEWPDIIPDPRLAYTPQVFRGLKSMKEFEDTLKALGNYFLDQKRSEEELVEVREKLGIWFDLVVNFHSFHNRVPK